VELKDLEHPQLGWSPQKCKPTDNTLIQMEFEEFQVRRIDVQKEEIDKKNQQQQPCPIDFNKF
jgi:hypothetical protein